MAAIVMTETPSGDSPSSIISLFEDDESRWQAVVTRNINADGFFVYGVKTTKIFCRPICKARLARRANVYFFENGCLATQAGFRPCKRCKPEVAGFMPEEAAVRKIRCFVMSRVNGGGGQAMMSLSQMAKQTGLSKWHFHRVFKKCVGVTPTEYLREQKKHGGGGVQMDWLQSLDGDGFDADFDFGWLNEPIVGLRPVVAQPLLSESPSTSTSEPSPWTMEDFVVWPEDATTGRA
ncbi:Fc.00g022840.m01.CDS01 [Cosmosporella sp. VM-42]